MRKVRYARKKLFYDSRLVWSSREFSPRLCGLPFTKMIMRPRSPRISIYGPLLNINLTAPTESRCFFPSFIKISMTVEKIPSPSWQRRTAHASFRDKTTVASALCVNRSHRREEPRSGRSETARFPNNLRQISLKALKGESMSLKYIKGL